MKYAALTISATSLAAVLWGAGSMAMSLKAHQGARLAAQTLISPMDPLKVQEFTVVQTSLDALHVATMDRVKDFPGEGDPAGTRRSVRPLMNGFDGIFASAEPPPPPKPMPQAKVALAAAAPAPVALGMPKVSLVMQAGTQGKAVVDGRLVGVGDVVAGDLTVKSITMDSVVFSGQGEEMVVTVPLERLRVLSAYPGTAPKGTP